MENRINGLDLLEDFINYRGDAGRELYHGVYGYLVNLSDGNRFKADDVMQEVLMKVVRLKERFHTISKAKPWLFTIARNKLSSYNRANNKHKRNERIYENGILEEGVLFELEDSGLKPDQEHERNEENEILLENVGRLPRKEKEVTKLRYLDELSTRGAADLLEVPIGTVKTRLHRSMKKLRRMYSKYAA